LLPSRRRTCPTTPRVVAGGEIGVAQYLQALACGLKPDVRMNPVLVKPEAANQSQVVVNGVADLALSRLSWRERSAHLVEAVDGALRSLLAEFDLVLVEGGRQSRRDQPAPQ
jgi:adenosylcobyric acid synthase